MKKKSSIILVVLMLIFSLSLITLASCNKPDDNDEPDDVDPGYTGGDTLVVGYDKFNNKFSPFFATTSYDMDAAGMTQVSLLSLDRQGNVVFNGIEGETRSYNGTPYTYTGMSNVAVDINETTGQVVYTITLRQGVTFSDGDPLTIDDVIFSMYVLSDPKYDGASTFYALPILGMKNYRTGVSDDVYTELSNTFDAIAAAGPDHEWTDADSWSHNAQTIFENAVEEQGLLLTQGIFDYVMDNYLSSTYASYMGPYTQEQIDASEGLKWAYAMRMWGYGSWTRAYEVNAEGTFGLVGEVYKTLYTPTLDAEAALFEDVNEVMFVKATASTPANQLYYIVSSDSSGHVTAAYEGDRYAPGAFDGKFKDALGTIYDCETEFPTLEAYWENILYTYGYDFSSDSGIGIESATGADFDAAVRSQFIYEVGPEYMGGNPINNISGIVKTGDYSMTITMSKYDATAIYQLGVSIAPLHYYGSAAAYNYANNQFGFTKGDLSGVRSKTTSPMGAGPYKFISYNQGVITYEKNNLYYKGAPKIKYILFKETTEGDKVAGTAGTTFDVSVPTLNNDVIAEIKSKNSNGEISGNVLHTYLVDFLGYGYIGINADTVKVGTDSKSEASKNLRKALATLLAVHRETVVNTYYGDRATVINYPISNTSWAAPQPADEGYKIAYSVDVNGNPIYTADMDDQAKYAAALNAAKGFFMAAGYTWNADTGKFTAAPDGASLVYTVIIPGGGNGDHPSFGILTAVAAQLASIGITLDINDPADSNELWNALDAGTQELWCAAWGATVDPDMYQVYHSSNVVGLGGTNSNHYHIQDATLDSLIMEARGSADNALRKATYKECLEIILDWAVEVPIYQRKDGTIINVTRVKLSTVTPDITTYWGWMSEIEKLEMY